MVYKNNKGQLLVAVLLAVAILGIFLPAVVLWVRQEAQWSVKEQQSTIAFNLADAGIERGMWKLKSSTYTWTMASEGGVITGYNFDTVYTDIPGGKYRIKFSSGPLVRSVTILSEGKDDKTGQVRAIRAVYQNQNIPGAVISKGVITWANAFSAHWGPIMSHNNINITDANAAQDYFPRKFSKQVVYCNQKGYERDSNGLNPPNTDGIEWWSDYPVPDLPELDFAALRSSAQATGTLNVYGCKKTGASWDKRSSCSTSGDHSKHFGNTYNYPNARKQYVFYWDDDVILAGGTGSYGSGIWGTIIARKNLTLDTGDNYSYTGPVPAEAWREYTIIQKTGSNTYYDTSAKNEYPADDGYQKNRTTFNFGGETWTRGQNPPPSYNTDVGIRGFVYVGGDLTINGPLDINGAVWVEGNVSKAVGSERCIIFFDDNLSNIPTLNVVLVRKSWDEVKPSSTPW